MTKPRNRIYWTVLLHMRDEWLRVVTDIHDEYVELLVTGGNTGSWGENREQRRIQVDNTGTGQQLDAADFREWLAIECLVALQQSFRAVVVARGQYFRTNTYCFWMV